MKKKFALIALIFFTLTPACGSKNSENASTAGDSTVMEKTEDTAKSPFDISDDTASTPLTEKVSAEDEDAVITRLVSNGKPSVIDFNATWCGPCKMMAPIFHKLAAKYSKDYNFISIDIDENKELADKYHISAVPTFIFIDADGVEGDRIKGAVEESTLEDMLKNPAWF